MKNSNIDLAKQAIAATEAAAPINAWNQRWERFAVDEHLNTRQRMFMNVLRTHTQMGRSLTAEDLPSPMPWSAGTMVQFDSVKGLHVVMDEQQINAMRKPHPWDRVGDFHSLFKPVEQERIIRFVSEMRESMPESMQKKLKSKYSP